MCHYHLNSIKTYGIKNILSRAEQQIGKCSGFLCWGRVPWDWVMTDGSGNKAHLTEGTGTKQIFRTWEFHFSSSFPVLAKHVSTPSYARGY